MYNQMGVVGIRSANPYSRAKHGRRADLGGQHFRSSWEANYARYLNFLVGRGDIVGWDYETETFEFHKIWRGTRTYTPDFRVRLVGGGHEWHEVKGWMDAKSRTKLKRFAKYYPAEKLVLIDAKWFKQANRGGLAALIPCWEHGGRKRPVVAEIVSAPPATARRAG
jgi:hypothetical protein